MAKVVRLAGGLDLAGWTPRGAPPSLVELARVQGARSGRRGGRPEQNPFTPDSPAWAAWEQARREAAACRGQLPLPALAVGGGGHG